MKRFKQFVADQKPAQEQQAQRARRLKKRLQPKSVAVSTNLAAGGSAGGEPSAGQQIHVGGNVTL